MHGLKKMARYGVLLLVAAVIAISQGCAHGRGPWASDQERSPKAANRKIPPNQPAICPVDTKNMYVSSTFGAKRKKHIHKGVDIVTAKGTPVRATATGKVAFAGRDGAYGNVMVVDHGNGISTYYAHLDKEFAKEGQEVKRGEIIGSVGSTGNASTPHVHYEVRKSGRPINPNGYLPG
jgi:murein DD-endopeptidase MepM/ murein hydrolase activator NlpD